MDFDGDSEFVKMFAPLDIIEFTWILLDMSEICCFKITHKLFDISNYFKRTLDRKC